MINKPAIIGCGTVGASLALELSRSKIISELKIYDNDIISITKKNLPYPFIAEEAGLSKVKVIEFQCKMLNPNIRIQANQKKLIHPLPTSIFTIDCRDCKYINIKANVRISLDGYLLYIDSLININPNNYSYYRYISPKNPDYIKKAIEIVIKYLKNDKYIFHELKLYNVKNGTEHILEKEN